MVKLEQIIHRFKKFKGIKFEKEVANSLNLSQGDYTNRKKRGTLLPLIIDSAINESVNLHWLLKGEGEMFAKTSGVLKTPNALNLKKNRKEMSDPKMTNYFFSEQTPTDIKGLEKRFDLVRQAADIDRKVTLRAMISLWEYLGKQIENMRNEKE